MSVPCNENVSRAKTFTDYATYQGDFPFRAGRVFVVTTPPPFLAKTFVESRKLDYVVFLETFYVARKCK